MMDYLRALETSDWKEDESLIIRINVVMTKLAKQFNHLIRSLEDDVVAKKNMQTIYLTKFLHRECPSQGLPSEDVSNRKTELQGVH